MNLGEIRMAAGDRPAPPPRGEDCDPLQELIARLPRLLRFLGVGSLGLVGDLAVFTVLAVQGVDPLLSRLVSLACATAVTWRLNRALTFAPSGREPREELLRYAAVTALAQATSYALFAALVLTLLGAMPQAAVLLGAAMGALVSYNGHRLFSFLPRAAHLRPTLG